MLKHYPECEGRNKNFNADGTNTVAAPGMVSALVQIFNEVQNQYWNILEIAASWFYVIENIYKDAVAKIR